MKKKAIRFIKDNKGSISLFVIVFVASLLMAALASLFGADRLARVVLSVSAGALTLMGVDSLGDKVGMRLGDSCRPAIIAIISGAIIALI